MRPNLIQLVKDTILFEYSLPCDIRKIEKTVIINDCDSCYKISGQKRMVKNY